MDKRYQFQPKLGQYLTHALDSMDKEFPREPGPRKYLKFLHRTARRAVKFTVPVLPPYPYHDVLEAHDFRPPYPVTAYEVDNVPAINDGRRYDGALVLIVIDKQDHAEIHFLFGDPASGASEGWTGSFFKAQLHYDVEVAGINERGMPRAAMELIPGMTEMFTVRNAHMDMADLKAMKEALIAQLGPMLQIHTSICYALCNNVTSSTDVPPDAKENRVRRIKGKTPLFTYKTLVIGEPKPQTKTRKGSGTHASPRSHLRRGHYRTGKSGNRYWVSAAFVNGAPGFVHKDYELRIGAL